MGEEEEEEETGGRPLSPRTQLPGTGSRCHIGRGPSPSHLMSCHSTQGHSPALKGEGEDRAGGRRPPKHSRAGNFPSARGWSRGLSKQVSKPLVSTLALRFAASGSSVPNWVSRVSDPGQGWAPPPGPQARGTEGSWPQLSGPARPGVASSAGCPPPSCLLPENYSQAPGIQKGIHSLLHLTHIYATPPSTSPCTGIFSIVRSLRLPVSQSCCYHSHSTNGDTAE